MAQITIPSYVEVDTQHCGFVGCGRGNSLSEVYRSYSSAKAAAWEHCESLCRELDGHCLCITSANTFVFTAQFEFDNPDNGRPMVCHITSSRTYAMYLDVRRIEVAKNIWREYAECYDGMPHSRTGWCAENGKDGVVWVDSFAYIVVGDEVYRVDNAFTRRGLRMYPALSKVGGMCDDVVDTLLYYGQAFCGVTVMCHVKLKLADNPMVYVGYVDDGVDGYGGGNSWDVVQPLKVCDGMAIVAACVDACSMIHCHDGHGASIKLMD